MNVRWNGTIYILYKYEFYVPVTGLISPEAFSGRGPSTIYRKGLLRAVLAFERKEALIIDNFGKYFKGNEVKENEMGMPCSTYMGSEVYKVEAEIPEGNIPLRRPVCRKVDSFKLSLEVIKR